jgi:biopolymer transport protein ExbD
VWSPSQAAVQRAAKRRSRFYSFINVWPFVSVTVVLLVLFMVVQPPPFHHYLSYPADLPMSVYASPQRLALREDAMRISIPKDGAVYFRGSNIAPEELPGLIRNALKEGSEKKVYLAVDIRSRYGATAKVVDQLRLAGIEHICFLAQKPSGR